MPCCLMTGWAGPVCEEGRSEMEAGRVIGLWSGWPWQVYSEFVETGKAPHTVQAA